MYVDSGSERNTLSPMPVDYATDRAVIERFDLKRLTPGTPFRWGDGEVVVRGARNVTGFTRDSKGRMYGVINGVDDLRYDGQDVHANNPGEYVVRLEAARRTSGSWPTFEPPKKSRKTEVATDRAARPMGQEDPIVSAELEKNVLRLKLLEVDVIATMPGNDIAALRAGMVDDDSIPPPPPSKPASKPKTGRPRTGDPSSKVD